MLIVLWRIGIACTGTVIGPNKRAHDATEAGTLCILGRIGGTCAKTYSFKHRRASIQCRWHWYLIDHIDLHMGATTLDLHQAALRRLKRKNGDYED